MGAARIGVTVLLVISAALMASARSDAAVARTVRVVSGTSNLTGIACQTATECIAVGEVGPQKDGAVVVSGATLGAVQEPSGSNELDGVACWSTTHCVAVGVGQTASDGVVASIVNGVAGGAQIVGGTSYLHGVACTSDGHCVAVGWEYCTGLCNGNEDLYGIVVPINDGSVAAVEEIPGTVTLQGVGCFGNTCVAAGTANDGHGAIVPISSGSAGGEVSLSDTGPLQGAACTSATSCVAVGYMLSDSSKGVVVPIDHGAPGAVESVPGGGGLWAVACPSASKCWISGDSASAPTKGGVASYEPGVGPDSMLPQTGTSRLYGIACSEEFSCAAAGQGPPLGSGPGVVDPIGAVEGVWKAKDVAAAIKDLPEALKKAVTYCTPHVLALIGFGTGVLMIGSVGILAVASLISAYATQPFCLATVKRVLVDWKRANDPPDRSYREVATVTPAVLPRAPSCQRWTGALNAFCVQLRADAQRWDAAGTQLAAAGEALATTQARESAALTAGDQAAADLQDKQIPHLEKLERTATSAESAAGMSMGQLLARNHVQFRMTAAQSSLVIKDLEKVLAKDHVTEADLIKYAPTGLAPRAIDILQALLTG